MIPLLALFGAFLAGSVPWGYLIARRHEGMDIRQHGSGNIGATNVTRVLGFRVGAVVLVLDVAKGFLPAFFAQKAGLDYVWVVAVGLAAFLGHVFTPWLGFKGGRGIAAWFGVQPFILGWSMLIPLLVFFGVAVPTRIVGLASILAVCAFLIALPVTPRVMQSLPAFLLCLLIAAIILYKHEGHFRRILEGKERKL